MSRKRDIPEHKTWIGIIFRCNYKSCKSYKNYGGRGIRVLWDSFEEFYKDMGPRPPGRSIERLDVNGHYCKENCIWIPMGDQAKNRRNTRKITANGKTMCLDDWAKESGISHETIRRRLKKGWSHQQAVTTPVPEDSKKYGAMGTAARRVKS